MKRKINRREKKDGKEKEKKEGVRKSRGRERKLEEREE
jgi:hypothetical protein